MKKEYLFLLVVIVVGLIAIFTLSFLMMGDENLSGAAIYGDSYTCIGADTQCCSAYRRGCITKNYCESCGGTWEKKV